MEDVDRLFVLSLGLVLAAWLLVGCASVDERVCGEGMALRHVSGGYVCEGFGVGTHWRRVALGS